MRREFSPSVRKQIVLRASATGQVICEGCDLVLGKKPYEIDHTIADALILDKSRTLTADDGKLLGKDCCHAVKTRTQDVPAIAEAKRRESKHLGIKAAKRPIPQRPKEVRASSKIALAPRNLYARPNRQETT